MGNISWLLQSLISVIVGVAVLASWFLTADDRGWYHYVGFIVVVCFGAVSVFSSFYAARRR